MINTKTEWLWTVTKINKLPQLSENYKISKKNKRKQL